MITKTLPFVLTFSLVPLSAQAVNFTSILNGAQEVPSVTTSGFGTAQGTLLGGPGSYVFKYTVNYSGLTAGIINPPGAHIHNAPAGSNGSIVHVLDGLSALVGTTAGTFVGDWSYDDTMNPLTDALAQALLNGETYFNIHTSFSRPGEIRGQILPAATVPEPATVLALIALGILGLTKPIVKQDQ